MSEILIHLAKTDFRGGEVVEGSVELKLDEPVPARGVRIHFNGYESSLRASGNGRYATQRVKNRNFFDDEITVFGEPKLDIKGLLADCVGGLFSREHYPIIDAGRYEYPFSYKLPDSLPGDYQSKFGDVMIQYRISAYVDIPLKVDIECNQRLTVYELHPPVERGESYSESKTCQLDADSYLGLTATIDKNMYLPNEKVRLRLDFDNQSARPVDKVSVSLCLVETLADDGGPTERRDSLDRIDFPDCSIEPSSTARRELVYKIPDNIYPTSTTGKLVHVEYRLLVDVDIPWAVDHCLEMPLFIRERPGSPAGIDTP